MSQQQFPAGWDEDRVRDVIDHYDSLTEEEQAAEDDEAAGEHSGVAIISVPEDLVPAIRQLLAARNGAVKHLSARRAVRVAEKNLPAAAGVEYVVNVDPVNMR